MIYDPRDWYWIVGGDDSQVFSSRRSVRVDVTDADYAAWCAVGGLPTRIANDDELKGVLRAANVPPFHLVPARVIVDRLQAAGKLEAARTALDAADLYTRERWNTRESIFADDPAARGLLAAVGAEPDEILAPVA